MARYFRHSHNDGWRLPIVMAILGANDALSTAVEIYCVYSYCITNWGNVAYLELQPWPIPAFCITTGVSAFICQSFLVHRVHKLTKQWAFTVALMIATCAAFAGSIWAGYEQIVNQQYADRSNGNAAVSMWLISSAVDDAAISGILLAYLYKARNVARQFESTRLEAPLTRMMLLTVETGGFTAAWAVVSLAVYLHSPSSNAAVGMGYCLGRLYSLTVLFCLAQRGSIHRDGSLGGSRHGVAGTSTKGRAGGGFGGRLVDGVAVTHQATVVIEEPDDHELASFGPRSGAGQRKQATFGATPARMYMVGSSEEDEVDEKKSYGRMEAV